MSITHAWNVHTHWSTRVHWPNGILSMTKRKQVGRTIHYLMRSTYVAAVLSPVAFVSVVFFSTYCVCVCAPFFGFQLIHRNSLIFNSLDRVFSLDILNIFHDYELHLMIFVPTTQIYTDTSDSNLTETCFACERILWSCLHFGNLIRIDTDAGKFVNVSSDEWKYDWHSTFQTDGHSLTHIERVRLRLQGKAK